MMAMYWHQVVCLVTLMHRCHLFSNTVSLRPHQTLWDSSITTLPVSFLLTAMTSLAMPLPLQESFSTALAQTSESPPLQRADMCQGISNWTAMECKSSCVRGDYRGSNQMGIDRKTPHLAGCTKRLTITAPFCAVRFSLPRYVAYVYFVFSD